MRTRANPRHPGGDRLALQESTNLSHNVWSSTNVTDKGINDFTRANSAIGDRFYQLFRP